MGVCEQVEGTSSIEEKWTRVMSEGKSLLNSALFGKEGDNIASADDLHHLLSGRRDNVTEVIKTDHLIRRFGLIGMAGLHPLSEARPSEVNKVRHFFHYCIFAILMLLCKGVRHCI